MWCYGFLTCHLLLYPLTVICVFTFTLWTWRVCVNFFFLLMCLGWAPRTPAKCFMSSLWCCIDPGSKKLSKRITCMTECWFSPSFLNRKQLRHLSMSAYSPACVSLLSLLLLAPALGRRSPARRWHITEPVYRILHEFHHHCDAVCPVNTVKAASG